MSTAAGRGLSEVDPGLLVYGFGTMTGAMVEGWLAAGMPPERIRAYNPRPKPAPPGVALVTALPDRASAVLVLGVKPALLGEAAGAAAHLAGPDTLVVSVLAGIDTAQLRAAFPRARGVVRLMPNLACALGQSATALYAEGLDGTARDEVTALAEQLGSAEWLAREGDFELVTALAGSGPAFVYRFVDALAGGAAALGLERGQAERLALAMTRGAANLAAEAAGRGVGPGELARRVASPGGMTQRGLDELDAGAALEELVTRCLRATRDRGFEMGGKTPPPADGRDGAGGSGFA